MTGGLSCRKPQLEQSSVARIPCSSRLLLLILNTLVHRGVARAASARGLTHSGSFLRVSGTAAVGCSSSTRTHTYAARLPGLRQITAKSIRTGRTLQTRPEIDADGVADQPLMHSAGGRPTSRHIGSGSPGRPAGCMTNTPASDRRPIRPYPNSERPPLPAPRAVGDCRSVPPGLCSSSGWEAPAFSVALAGPTSP